MLGTGALTVVHLPVSNFSDRLGLFVLLLGASVFVGKPKHLALIQSL